MSRAQRWTAAGVLSLSLLVIVMDLTVLNIAIPDLAEDLRPSSNQLLWIVDSYSLVLAGVLVSVSAIGDRWGRRKMLMAGYGVFGAASALASSADSAEAVIAIRSVLGLGAAMIMPTTLSMLRTVFQDPKERATALALWASVAGIGAAIGPLVGGALLEAFSWRSAFKRPQFTAGVVAALGAVLALAAAMLLLAQWMQLVEGYSPIEAGVRLVPSALAGAVAAGISPWLASKLGARNVLAGSLALAAAGMVLICAAPGELHYPTVLVALVMVGAGTGALALGSAMIMSGTPEDRAGNAAAIEEVAYDFGNVLGVAILGSVAALLYRAGLEGDHVLGGLQQELAGAVGESVGNAVAIAGELGQPAIAQAAAVEFTHALEVTSMIGGLTLFAVAALVYLLTPRDVDVTQQH